MTAYVTRVDHGRNEVLVFHHPDAGIQLPAGTVEDGEAPIDAALREVEEETGLRDARIVRELGVQETVVPPHQRAVREASSLLAEPSPNSARLAMVGRTGFFVDADVLDGPYRQVTHHEYEFVDNVFAPIRSTSGWMLDEHLTDRIVRHHYELQTTHPAADCWTHVLEGEHDVELYWAPLREDIALAASNLAWLQFVIDKLRQ